VQNGVLRGYWVWGYSTCRTGCLESIGSEFTLSAERSA
jgi:hypothetical protein